MYTAQLDDDPNPTKDTIYRTTIGLSTYLFVDNDSDVYRS
jgi:hypothetical protein